MAGILRLGLNKRDERMQVRETIVGTLESLGMINRTRGGAPVNAWKPGHVA